MPVMRLSSDGTEMSEQSQLSSQRIALLVPGMHRSGTSALSGVLVKLGAQEPRSLMPATKDNPKGYWESTALMQFHDEVLKSGGTAWSDWDQFNPDWIQSPVAPDFLALMPGILEQEYGDARMMLVKDPRMCRLLPIWLRILPELAITPKFIIPLRHPSDVARSLAVRNDFGRNRAYLLWLRHVLDAEYQSRPYDRVLVEYSALLADWRTQSRRISDFLNLKWPRWSAQVQAEIDQYLSADLRHHDTTSVLPDASGIIGWAESAYEALKLMAAGEQIERATAQLDGLRTELNGSGAIYASVLRENESRARGAAQALTRRMEDAIAQKDTAEAQKRDAEEKKGDAEAQKRDADAQRESVARELNEARLASEAQRRDADAQRESVERELNEARLAAGAREAELKSEHAALQHKIELDVQRLNADREKLRSTIETMLASRRELERRIDEKERHIQKLDKKCQEETRLRFSETAKLTELLLSSNSKLAAERRRSDREAASQKVALESVRSSYETRLAVLSERLQRFRNAAVSLENSRSWKATRPLRRLAGAPAGSVLARQEVTEAEVALIRQSSQFDSRWYLATYRDVADSGMDPVIHYVRFGGAEMRNPSASFDARKYLEAHPDVLPGENPLLHHLIYERTGE